MSVGLSLMRKTSIYYLYRVLAINDPLRKSRGRVEKVPLFCGP